MSVIPAVPDNPDANPTVPEVSAIQTTSATFQEKNAKLPDCSRLYVTAKLLMIISNS